MAVKCARRVEQTALDVQVVLNGNVRGEAQHSTPSLSLRDFLGETFIQKYKTAGLLATGWTVRISNPGRDEISAPFQTGPGSHNLLCSAYRLPFPGVKRPGRGVDHPSPASAEVKERVELCFCSSVGLHGNCVT